MNVYGSFHLWAGLGPAFFGLTFNTREKSHEREREERVALQQTRPDCFNGQARVSMFKGGLYLGHLLKARVGP